MSCHRAHSTYRSVEEPLKQRTDNPQPVTTFLFEWAFSLEHGAEDGAGWRVALYRGKDGLRGLQTSRLW